MKNSLVYSRYDSLLYIKPSVSSNVFSVEKWKGRHVQETSIDILIKMSSFPLRQIRGGEGLYQFGARNETGHLIPFSL